MTYLLFFAQPGPCLEALKIKKPCQLSEGLGPANQWPPSCILSFLYSTEKEHLLPYPQLQLRMDLFQEKGRKSIGNNDQTQENEIRNLGRQHPGSRSSGLSDYNFGIFWLVLQADFEVKQPGIQALSSTLTSSVNLRRLLAFSEPHFPQF